MKHFAEIKKEIEALSPDIHVSEERGCIVLRGEVQNWETVIKAGRMAVNKKYSNGVVNDLQLAGFQQTRWVPGDEDQSLDDTRPDVLIVGGGITGCAAARELARWKLDVLLVEKGADVAFGASRANGGVVHVGINFPKKSQKHHYNQIGNAMYQELSTQLDVPFEQKGQVMLCCRPWEQIPVFFLRLNGKRLGIPGVKYLKRSELLKVEPGVPEFMHGGMYMPIGGITSPHEMTIALAENAVKNGVKISLNTAVCGMQIENETIVSVTTNRGTIYPKLVINAAGVYADEIAQMAGDRTFTIHPRRGTDIITDKKAGYMVNTSMGKAPFSILPYQESEIKGGALGRLKYLMGSLKNKNHTKGVGLIHSAHGNMLFGPNAVETPDREDTSTRRDEVDDIIEMQQHLAENLKKSDIIAYFTGVRAPTYEEDFVVRKGIFTHNILEAAGIQSPGVTAAPAIAVDLAKWTVEYLGQTAKVEKNEAFDPLRKAPPRMAQLSEEEQDRLIKQNPDYGVIVCRCEQVSKGEILDALHSPLCVPTLDGIKRRLRPGMGRCQGGFCSPLITQLIADELGIPLSEVKKSTPMSTVVYGETKRCKDETN